MDADGLVFSAGGDGGGVSGVCVWILWRSGERSSESGKGVI